MKNVFSARWYILCDIVMELILCHMECGKVSVATVSDQSPINVTGSTSKKKIFIFTNTSNCRSQFPRTV